MLRVRVGDERARFISETPCHLSESGMAVKKIVELVGSSPRSWEDAAGNALKEAAKTIRNITSLHVVQYTAKVQKNKIVEYRALVRIAFTVERISA